MGFLAYHGLSLKYIVDTHSHADHFTAAYQLKALTGAEYVMSSLAPSPSIDRYVNDGDVLPLGDKSVKVLHTPGHTPDSISLYTGERVVCAP